jgi:hypothetical protein
MIQIFPQGSRNIPIIVREKSRSKLNDAKQMSKRLEP